MKYDPWVKLQTDLIPFATNPMAAASKIPLLKTTPVLSGSHEDQEAKLAKVWRWAGLIAGPALAYHGFKRTGSVGWAVAWSAFGSVLPFLAVPVAVAQGFGEPKRGS